LINELMNSTVLCRETAASCAAAARRASAAGSAEGECGGGASLCRGTVLGLHGWWGIDAVSL